MSDSEAYMKAILDAITLAVASEISAAGRDDKFVGRSAGGQPPPLADKFFISVHDGTAENVAAPGGDYQDVMHGCSITFSQRVEVAEDKIGADLLPVLRARISTVTSYLGNNRYTIMTAANALLTLTSTNGFIEPMIVLNQQVNIVRRRGDWFHARDKGRGKASDGLTATIRLGQARRLQGYGGVN